MATLVHRPRMSARGWAAFRSRDFRLFCAARFCVSLAMQMQTVAVAWLVYDVTRSAFALGLVGLASFLPTVSLVLLTGLAADRYDRRRILLLAYGAMGVSALGLLAHVWSGAGRIWPVYLLLIGFGAGRAFANPTGHALVPNLVPPEDLGNAIALNSSTLQVATIAGPAVGGLLYAVSPSAPFLAAASCFGLATLFVLALRARGAPARREAATWPRLLAGLTFIRSRPAVLGAITLDMVAVLLGGATALLPIFAQDVHGVGPWGLGLMRSMPAVGAFAMALVLAHGFLLERQAGRRLLQTVAVFGIATIGFGLSRSLPLTLLLLAVMGAADMVSVVIRQTLVQADTPDELRGRVAAVNTLFIGASNELGEFESGMLAGLVGAAPAVILGGVGTIAVSLLWARLFPALRDRDRLVSDRAPAS